MPSAVTTTYNSDGSITVHNFGLDFRVPTGPTQHNDVADLQASSPMMPYLYYAHYGWSGLCARYPTWSGHCGFDCTSAGPGTGATCPFPTQESGP